MNSFVGVLAFVVVLLVGVNCRHVDNNDYEDTLDTEHSDLLNKIRDSPSQMRHRRRSRQMFPYDYPPYYYSENRRDHQQEEYLARILKSLDEIISNMRRAPPPPPPPAPQPIYIPYPVIHYQSSCGNPTKTPKPIKPSTPNETAIPTIGPNLGIIEDEQIWGINPVEIKEEDYEGDGSRPISFVPVEPSRPVRPAPPVDHGTQEGGVEQTTRAPVAKPGRCEAAILSCCSDPSNTARRNCFTRYGCTSTFATNRACDPNVIKRVLEHFSKAYAPDSNV